MELLVLKEGTPEKLDQYVTTEDILFANIEPKLERILNDQYGK